MSIIKRIKTKITKPNPIKAVSNMPSFAMTAAMRHNALGLEASYGNTQFVQRVRAAADIIDELETALMAIAFSSNDPMAKDIANDALDQYANMKK